MGKVLNFKSPHQATPEIKKLERTLCEYDKRLLELEIKTERRQRPKRKVVNVHKGAVKNLYGNRCPCCMGDLKKPELDHFFSRSWGGVTDTWLICSECNQGLYQGRLVRAEILPRFQAYQAHLKSFLGGEQLTFLPKTKIIPQPSPKPTGENEREF